MRSDVPFFAEVLYSGAIFRRSAVTLAALLRNLSTPAVGADAAESREDWGGRKPRRPDAGEKAVGMRSAPQAPAGTCEERKLLPGLLEGLFGEALGVGAGDYQGAVGIFHAAGQQVHGSQAQRNLVIAVHVGGLVHHGGDVLLHLG